MLYYCIQSVQFLSYTDLTAGGCVREVAQWQIDDNTIIARLDNEWQSLRNPTNADIHNFKVFTMFLQSHDGNVATAFKWFLEAIKRLHKDLSMFADTKNQHWRYCHSPQFYPMANRYYYCVPFYPLICIQYGPVIF